MALAQRLNELAARQLTGASQVRGPCTPATTTD